MKKRIALTDFNPEERSEAIYNKFDELGILSNPNMFRISGLYLSSTQKNRIGIISDDIACIRQVTLFFLSIFTDSVF